MINDFDIFVKLVPYLIALLSIRAIIVFVKIIRIAVNRANGQLMIGKHFDDELNNVRSPFLLFIRIMESVFWISLIIFCVYAAYFYATESKYLPFESLIVTVMMYSLMSLFLIPIAYYISFFTLEKYFIELLDNSLSGDFNLFKSSGFVILWTLFFMVLLGFLTFSSCGYYDGMAYLTKILGISLIISFMASLIGVMMGFLPGAGQFLGNTVKPLSWSQGGFFTLSFLQMDTLPVYFIYAIYLFVIDHSSSRYGESLFFVAIMVSYLLITGCRAVLTKSYSALIWVRFSAESGPWGADVFCKMHFNGIQVVLYGLVRMALSIPILLQFYTTWGWNLVP